MDPDKAPIFVIGTGRSGTTLLRLMLSAHPRIYVAHEASFYVWESTGGRSVRRDVLRSYLQTFSFRWLRLDASRVLDGLPDPLPRDRLRDAYTAVMREKAAQYGKPRWGDKTPLHAFHLDRVFRDYPEARVVRIVRDPRATVQSLMRMPWSSGTVSFNARYCENERRKVEPFRDRILEISLEDLIADARATLGRVLEFVGEPWDDAVLDHSAHRCDPHDMPPLPWFEAATRSLSRPSGSEWGRLTPAQVRFIERVNRRTMEEVGYQAAHFAEEPSRTSVTWASLREIPELVRSAVVAVRIALASRRSRNQRTPEMDVLFRRLNPGSWQHYPGLQVPEAPPLRGLPAPGAIAGG
jgi:hypothetical protein